MGQQHFPASQESYLGKLTKDREILRWHVDGERPEVEGGSERENPGGHRLQMSNREALVQSLPQIQMVLCLQVWRIPGHSAYHT